jgi:hypothetical protein
VGLSGTTSNYCKMGKLLLIKVALMANLQLSPRGFDLCSLRLQCQILTVELTPHGW